MTHTVDAQGRTTRIPGPDHPITLERNPNRVVISAAGRIIADTREALTLREARYPAVFYIARERRHLWSSRPGPWLLASRHCSRYSNRT